MAAADDAAPATTAPAATSPTPEQKSANDPIVCKKLGAPLGSRIGDRRVCMKASQWAQQQQDDQDAMRKIHPGGTPGGN